MSTYNELYFDIVETVKNNYVIDDTELTEELVLHHINIQRALWIRQEYNKPGRTIDPSVQQDLGCVQLELADPADCCTEVTNCKILRTVEEIPTPIEFYNSTGITRVGAVNKLLPNFSLVDFSQIPFVGNGKYNKNAIFAFILNNRIYLLTNNPQYRLLDYINIRGVFEDPKEAEEFNPCETGDCFSLDMQYPLNDWMWPFIKDNVIKQILATINIPQDKTNDAREEIRPIK